MRQLRKYRGTEMQTEMRGRNKLLCHGQKVVTYSVDTS